MAALRCVCHIAIVIVFGFVCFCSFFVVVVFAFVDFLCVWFLWFPLCFFDVHLFGAECVAVYSGVGAGGGV